MRKWSALVVVVVTLSLGAHGVARADDRRCELDPDTGQLKCVLVAQPSPPLSVRLSVELPLVWKRAPFNDWEMVARGHGCTRSTADVTEVGIGYVVTLINTATLDQLYLDYVCEWPGGSRRSRHRLRPPRRNSSRRTRRRCRSGPRRARRGPSVGSPASTPGSGVPTPARWQRECPSVAGRRRRRRGRPVGVGDRWPGWRSGHEHVVRLRRSPLGLLDAGDERRVRGHVDGRLGRHLGSHVERRPDGVVPSGADQPDRASAGVPRR